MATEPSHLVLQPKIKICQIVFARYINPITAFYSKNFSKKKQHSIKSSSNFQGMFKTNT